MHCRELILGLALAIVVGLPSAMAVVVIDTVLVGDAGNASDSTGLGAVGYAYRMGTYEVTNAQYADFLNAKAASDPFSLWDGGMSITRSGVSGSFTYAAQAGLENRPVWNVNWYDSLRFANWLHNGQGAGDTETGAYTLLGGMAIPSNGATITRNLGATWFLPSTNEWYKAAYYDPGTDSYFDYPTSSDVAPTRDVPPGNNNSANYFNGSALGVTDVGAYTLSTSPVGAYDMGGNVSEWTEDFSIVITTDRELRGGNWAGGVMMLMASASSLDRAAHNAGQDAGFRVAALSAVPEATSLLLLSAVTTVSLVTHSIWRLKRAGGKRLHDAIA